MTVCRNCDYRPCICGQYDYPSVSDTPPYCRVCDYFPCACGSRQYMTDAEFKELCDKKEAERLANPDPMDLGIPPDID